MTSPELERLLAEIDEQPLVVERLLARQRDLVVRLAAAIRSREPAAIVLVARGSSDNAAVYGRYLFEVCNRQLTSLAAPSGLTLYERGPRLGDTVVIGVSQSGQGEDVVAYLRAAREQGALTVGIVNDEQSPLARTAEWMLECLAGPEVSIPATKTVTAQMTLLAMLSSALGDQSGDAAGLDGLAEALRGALAERPAGRRLGQFLATMSPASVIGRGFAFPPALEIALKFKETSYTAAEPFSAADFLHGPVALVDQEFSAVLIDVGGRSSAAAADIAAAVRQRKGQPALIRAGRLGSAIDAAAAVALDVPLDEPFAPIPALVLGQLVAVELALARGIDPARPRGLRKVTSTR